MWRDTCQRERTDRRTSRDSPIFDENVSFNCRKNSTEGKTAFVTQMLATNYSPKPALREPLNLAGQSRHLRVGAWGRQKSSAARIGVTSVFHPLIKLPHNNTLPPAGWRLRVGAVPDGKKTSHEGLRGDVSGVGFHESRQHFLFPEQTRTGASKGKRVSRARKHYQQLRSYARLSLRPRYESVDFPLSQYGRVALALHVRGAVVMMSLELGANPEILLLRALESEGTTMPLETYRRSKGSKSRETCDTAVSPPVRAPSGIHLWSER